jgi:RNA-directed DNA polymerase
MTDQETGTRPERAERHRKVGSGTAEGTDAESIAVTARGEHPSDETMMLMEQALRRENLMAALKRVVRNGGAPGVDGMSADELGDHCRKHWPRIREELLSGRYQPMPVRKVEIPKPGGGVRTLGIPTVLDRMIQQALLQVLQPEWDATFSEASYGFRPNRSAHQAVLRARDHIADGYRWVVDLDIERFFDRVNHDVLMARVARRIEDKRVLRLIRRYLQAGMMQGGLVSPRAEGTPQGGPLSPLLSNLLLDELDRELERRGHRFVRYADDCNVYVKSKAAGERVMVSLEKFLSERLRLRINRDKSAVDRPWKRAFLSYTVTHDKKPKLAIAGKAVVRLRTRLREILRRGRGRRMDRVIAEMTPLLRGWVAYFRYSQVKARLEELDQWLRRRLRCIAWRQWKRPATRFRELVRRGVGRQQAAVGSGNGYGPWWNAGASHMNLALPTSALRRLGLLSLLEEHRRLMGVS